jgi:outer membrane protein insertion porin family
MFSHSLRWILFFLCVVNASLLSAQDDALVQPVVGQIEIEFKDIKNISEEAIRARIQIRVGMEYNQSLIDRSIRSLYNTGFLDFIEVKTEVLPDGKSKLIFLVQAKYRIKDIYFEGNRRLKQTRLQEEIISRENGVLDERRINDDSDKLLEYYQSKGFSQVSVDYEITKDSKTGYGDVVFRIDEGQKLKIAYVKFTNNKAISDRKLKKTLDTKNFSFVNSFFGKGRFKDEILQEDIDKLLALYKQKGYLDVDISDASVTLDYPSSNTIGVTIDINEGRQYRVGNVTFDGNTLYSDVELMRPLKLQPGDVFSPSLLDEDRNKVSNAFGQIGYLDTSVRAERRPNLVTGDIDIHYNIRESEEILVESINIEGNTKTKSVVILREISLSPGDVFDRVRMKSSESRLINTQYFENVSVTPEKTNIPGRRNMKISLKEGRTGNLTFGAGFSSLKKGLFSAEVSQGNFDLFNFRSFFQGDGQKMRLFAEIGSNSEEYGITFVEPWLFDQRLAFEVDLFRIETDFVSVSFNELRTGLRTSLRKRLFNNIDGRLTYSYEIVDIFDVSPFASPIIRGEEGKRSVSKIELDLIRDFRDRIIYSRRGNRVELKTSFAGLGGDTDYFKIEGRGSQYFPTHDYLDQTLSIFARAGSVFDRGSNGVPFFDRFFLGGPDDIRGFEFRQVGPKDIQRGPSGAITSIDNIGGNSFGFFTVEYTFKLSEGMRFAVFYDLGFVNPDEGDFSFSRYNSSWGFGIRVQVLGAPMRLDFGIPITTDEFNDEGNQFHFTFGPRF